MECDSRHSGLAEVLGQTPDLSMGDGVLLSVSDDIQGPDRLEQTPDSSMG